MRRIVLGIAVSLLMTPFAAAQQAAPPPPGMIEKAFVDKVISNFQQEVTQKTTDLYNTRAWLATVAEENAKLRGEIEELRKKAAAPVPSEPPKTP